MTIKYKENSVFEKIKTSLFKNKPLSNPSKDTVDCFLSSCFMGDVKKVIDYIKMGFPVERYSEEAVKNSIMSLDENLVKVVVGAIGEISEKDILNLEDIKRKKSNDKTKDFFDLIEREIYSLY